MAESTFTFSSEARMRELVAKANKALGKLALGVIRVLSTSLRKVKTGNFNALGQDEVVVVLDAVLDIPAELVKIQGQEIVARLERIEGQNMISRLGADRELDLDAYRTADIECQHCGLKRHRKASWIVKDEAKGLLQVGDNCADLYFGLDVSAILNTATAVFGILDSDEWGGPGRGNYDFGAFTSYVTWITMTSGFVTKKQAGDYSSGATALVADTLTRPCLSAEPKIREDYYRRQGEHRDWREANFKEDNLLSLATDWWLERTELSEFEHNCRLALLSQDTRFLGLSAFAIKLWIDANYGSAEAEKLRSSAESNWIGEIKQRLTFPALKVVNLASYETDFGTKTVVTFQDETGNDLVWKASVNPYVTLGQRYNVKGTIKEHKDYKGRKQTLLSRCEIRDVAEEACVGD